MGLFSRIWEQMAGSKRGAAPAKHLSERSLHLEPLEDRALLSVTPGAMLTAPAAADGVMETADNFARAALTSDTFTDALVPVRAANQTLDRSAALNESKPALSWDLANYSDYTTFLIDVIEDQVYLYGRAKEGAPFEVLEHETFTSGDNITVNSDNTARDVTFKPGALMTFSEIFYIGGQTKNDTITLEGTDSSDYFTIDQETRLSDVRERPGKAAAREVVFEKVSTYINGNSVTVKMSGTRTIAIDGMAGDDQFVFLKMGTTYDIKAGDGNDMLDFSRANSGIKLNLGKTTAQSVISGQKGKLCLHGDIENVIGSRLNDSITTTANTLLVNNGGGSDTITLVGDESTVTTVNLVYGSHHRVTGKGNGNFTVYLAQSPKSTVNMSSVKSGSLSLDAFTSDHVRVSGTKGDDIIRIMVGNNADVQGNDGNDFIEISSSTNAKVQGGKGDDVIYMMDDVYGKCTIDAGEGNDLVLGGNGNDTIKARSGNNILIGGEGADKITGGRGRDILIANTTPADWRYLDYPKLIEYWSTGNVEETLKMLGEVSIADNRKDVLKRGSGAGNIFYANTSPSEYDFDTVDCKLDKGDMLFTGQEPGNF